MTEQKRESERLELLGALQGEVMVFQPTAICEISKGGMQIETTFPLQLDSLHEFRLTLGDCSIVVKGRVVHSHISECDPEAVRYRSGIEFIELTPRVEWVIRDFVELLRELRATES